TRHKVAIRPRPSRNCANLHPITASTSMGPDMNTTSTASLIAERIPGFSLPRELYCGQQAFQDDLEQIWYREWLFAGPSCEIPKTGNYVTMNVGAYPVVVIRGADGRVRAFHNVCRHRGQRLCAKTSGSNPKLVCPYHQWTYDLDGKLLYARDMG